MAPCRRCPQCRLTSVSCCGLTRMALKAIDVATRSSEGGMTMTSGTGTGNVRADMAVLVKATGALVHPMSAVCLVRCVGASRVHCSPALLMYVP